MLLLAKVDGGREVAYALSALGCLVVAWILITVVAVTRSQRIDWSRLRRFMWGLGGVTGVILALAGVAFGGLWAAGADWSLDFSSSSSSSSAFCATHACIPNFDDGQGSIVQCADGSYSHSGGIQGACSHHGGEG